MKELYHSSQGSSSLDQFTDARGQRIDRERFGQHRHTRFQLAVVE